MYLLLRKAHLLNFLAPAMNIDCVVSQHYNIGSEWGPPGPQCLLRQ